MTSRGQATMERMEANSDTQVIRRPRRKRPVPEWNSEITES